jgi:hypothetical protein
MKTGALASGLLVRHGGAAALEFQIISFLVLIPLLMGVLQLGLLMVAKNTVNVATLGAARAGAAAGGDKAAMQHALVLGLTPLHASGGKQVAGVGMGDINTGNYTAVMAAAYTESKLSTGLFGRITVLNPTAKAFADFGIDKAGVGRVIPVTNALDNATVGRSSRQTRADSLLLKIEVRYCYKMDVPIIDDIIGSVLAGPLSGTSLEDKACYRLRRVPVTSQAVVRMTVSPVQSALLK